MAGFAISFLISFYVFFLNILMTSLGMAFTYGVTRILNLAQGTFFVLGGYLASVFAWQMGLAFGIAAAAAASLALGPLFYLYVKALGRTELEQLFATYALLLIGEGLFKLVFGNGNYTTASLADGLGSVEVLGQQVPYSYLWGGAVAAALLALMYLLLARTRAGLYMRAVRDDAEMASALGINVREVGLSASALGILITAASGAASSMWQAFTLGLSGQILVYAFASLVVGGIGDLLGVVAASAVISAVRTAAVFLYPQLELVAIYLVVIAVLLTRPSGLFARHARLA
ncbi:MAG: branched-chain amino acid ABC transporter permease [Thermoproteus sp.]